MTHPLTGDERQRLLAEADTALAEAGLPDPVVDRIRRIRAVHLLKQELARRSTEPQWGSVQHFAFTGDDTSAHETAAGILSKVYTGLGLLTVPEAMTVRRADLLSPYVGQTALRTAAAMEQAAGGTLLLAEAPDLMYADREDPFGMEALDTVLGSDALRKNQVCVILSGTRAGIDQLMRRHAGVSARFHNILDFDSVA